MATYYKTVLSHFSQFLPEKIVTNDDLSHLMDTNDTWIKERSGISERRFAEEPHRRWCCRCCL